MRSKWERKVAQWLTDHEVQYHYEPGQFTFEQTGKIRNTQCYHCGEREMVTVRKYTPDFYLPKHDLYLETKGRFMADDRKILVGMADSNPWIKIVMGFQKPGWVGKRGVTSYEDWCFTRGIRAWTGKGGFEEWMYELEGV